MRKFQENSTEANHYSRRGCGLTCLRKPRSILCREIRTPPFTDTRFATPAAATRQPLRSHYDGWLPCLFLHTWGTLYILQLEPRHSAMGCNIAGIRVTYHYCSLRGLDHQIAERNGIPNTVRLQNAMSYTRLYLSIVYILLIWYIHNRVQKDSTIGFPLKDMC